MINANKTPTASWCSKFKMKVKLAIVCIFCLIGTANVSAQLHGTSPPYAQLSDFGNSNSACGSGNGNEYWVDINDPNANDAGSGTESDPWKTLVYASNTVQAGDIVNVMPGIYIDSSTTNNRPFEPVNNGVEGNPIIFRSVVPHQAILKSTAPDTAMAYEDKALALRYKNDIIYDGFKTIGMVHFRNAQRVDFINGEVTVGSTSGDPSLFWGISIENSSYCVIKNNKVHEMTISLRSDGTQNYTHNQAGIMVINGTSIMSENNLITHNYIDGGNTDTVYSGLGNKGGNLSDNLWKNNFIKNTEVGIFSTGSTNGLLDVYNSYYVNNIIVDSPTGIRFSNRTNDTYLVNNTFVRNTFTAVEFSALSSPGTVFINNAVFDAGFYVRTGQIAGIPGLEYKDMYTLADFNQFEDINQWASIENVPLSMAEWNNAGLDLNSLVVPFNFINPTGVEPEDFKRAAYTPNGIGGEYSTSVGAYTSNDDIVGTFTEKQCVPAIIDVIFNNSFE